MMALFATDRTVLPVKEYALADVDLHVALGSPRALARSVAKGALGVRKLYDALPGADRAVLCLHHIRYTIS